MYKEQCPTGRCFQLRDGMGSVIEKKFGFGSGLGIGTAFLSIGYYRVLNVSSNDLNDDLNDDHEHEKSNNQELHAIRHQELHDLLLCRRRLGNSFPMSFNRILEVAKRRMAMRASSSVEPA